MAWALQIPRTTLSDSSARHVLLCLANYAGTDGRGAFPSATTLSEDTGLSERTVRSKLELLRVSELIVPGNQALAAVYIERHDRRPVVYDLPIKRGANPAPRTERGADDGTGCKLQQNGVQNSAERGAKSAPNTSLNHQLTEQQQPREISDRQRFAMFADWAPDSRYLIAQAQIAGVKPADIPDALIRSFIGWFVAKQNTVDTSAGWCNRL
ncbi:helix-turn-helix domain-containing protein, partial [Pseudomonas sp. ICMP 10191]|uniref:helix-turn-helix domain-containing protein n=1 Tax=Pseudomonas sp. ICMP 10191 TaxID=1198294 RepID=UPI000731B1B8